jgi:predicted secreted protein
VKWTSILAIYALFWVMSAFIMLRFEGQTSEEAGIETVPGQADSAPADFRPGRVVLRATIVAAAAFGLYYANYVEGWLTADQLDWSRDLPGAPR